MGFPVDVADSRVVTVSASDVELMSGVLAPRYLAAPLVARVGLLAGEPITASEVEPVSRVRVLGEMSIAVPAQQAVGGTISPGALVDVISANGSGGASYVAQALRVVSVDTASQSTPLGGSGGGYFVVVAVSKAQALRISAALGGGSLGGSGQVEVVLSTGEAPTGDLTYNDGEPNASSGSSLAGGGGAGGASLSR